MKVESIGKKCRLVLAVPRERACSWYWIRNWQAWNLLGFMTYSSCRRAAFSFFRYSW